MDKIYRVKVTNYISDKWYITEWNRSKGVLLRPNHTWTPKVNGESIREVFGPYGWQQYSEFIEDVRE